MATEKQNKVAHPTAFSLLVDFVALLSQRMALYVLPRNISTKVIHYMTATDTINDLIRSTFKRAVRESIVGIILMGYFAYSMQTIASGTPQFYGTILIIASLGFIMGVLWSYVISYHTLRIHPESDTPFWREAFLAQSRLLRSAPLWYLAPILTGVMITALPAKGTSYAEFMLMFVTCGMIFAGLTWLNRNASKKIEEQAQSFV